jgi:hypothetical protein
LSYHLRFTAQRVYARHNKVRVQSIAKTLLPFRAHPSFVPPPPLPLGNIKHAACAPRSSQLPDEQERRKKNIYKVSEESAPRPSVTAPRVGASTLAFFAAREQWTLITSNWQFVWKQMSVRRFPMPAWQVIRNMHQAKRRATPVLISKMLFCFFQGGRTAASFGKWWMGRLMSL